MASRSAVLYQNASKTVTLLDIPRSIALAQAMSDNPSHKRLFSSPALEVPWPSTEPVSGKAKANVTSHGMGSRSNATLESQVQEVLDELLITWKGDWCLERKTKSKLQEPDTLASKKPLEGWKSLEPLILEKSLAEPLHLQHFQGRPVSNPTPRPFSLLVATGLEHHVLSSKTDANSTCYSIPPFSTFIISSISSPDNGAFSMGALTLLPDYSSTTLAGPGEFDSVLLDPPWSNRSARRSRSYETSGDPIEGLKSTLGQHIATRGIVACWITNNSTSRTIAMQAFEAWDVALVEEWCWLKVTRDGRPVTDIQGLWRKPYELLLVGRKGVQHDDCTSSPSSSGLRQEVKRRVVVAVPDVHSRKPCIKQLVEEAFGFEVGKYRALEVFARNLTVGWWAWGDECLRFQWDGWWDVDDDVDENKGGEGKEEKS